MNLTHLASSPLAGSRRELVGVLALVALVLAVLGVCGIHLGAAAAGSGHLHGVSAEAHGHGAAGSAASVGDVVEPLGADAHCADHGVVTAQGDAARTVPQGVAVLPDLAVRWLVPAMAGQGPSVPSGVVAAAAPSLHALGISRT